jgi:predicted nuclease of restriction endonuclease-like (RecB) superfamily
MTGIIKHLEYRDWLRDLKQQIKTGQIKAALSVNSQMIMLYWDLGRQIVDKQKKTQWGSGFIEQLSKDLKEEFPEMTGFSYDNLRFCKRFYLFYSQLSEQPVPKFETQIMKQVASLLPVIDSVKPEQVVPKLKDSDNQNMIISEQVVLQFSCVPWGHHILILKKIKNTKEAFFYINKTIENNWSRAVLEYQIESNLYGRQGKAATNFNLMQGDLANELMKDPYNFDFLRLSDKVKEADLEKALMQHISQFMPELAAEIKTALPFVEELQNELLNFEKEYKSAISDVMIGDKYHHLITNH